MLPIKKMHSLPGRTSGRVTSALLIFDEVKRTRGSPRSCSGQSIARTSNKKNKGTIKEVTGKSCAD